MKIDRLLNLTIYLLNHGRCSSQTLAARFEVSKRTIQRDMECLNLAGIPVVSQSGTDGGYAIIDTFSMDRQAATSQDYSAMSTAVRALRTAYDDPKLDNLFEKLTSLKNISHKPLTMIPDFSVLKENSHINDMLKLLGSALEQKKTVIFDYTNADGVFKTHEAEPVILTCQWYAWYLLTFSHNANDYRLYKIQRMENITVTSNPIRKEHHNPEIILQNYLAKDNRAYFDIRLKCKAELRIPAQEYLQGTMEKEFENGDFILHLYYPQNERIWFGVLLSFGNKAEVLEPKELQTKLRRTAEEISSLYSE